MTQFHLVRIREFPLNQLSLCFKDLHLSSLTRDSQQQCYRTQPSCSFDGLCVWQELNPSFQPVNLQDFPRAKSNFFLLLILLSWLLPVGSVWPGGECVECASSADQPAALHQPGGLPRLPLPELRPPPHLRAPRRREGGDTSGRGLQGKYIIKYY